ncbi:hypothetical protein LINGRAHAP2_LOCUS32152, partial [Linum grandiflorum]
MIWVDLPIPDFTSFCRLCQRPFSSSNQRNFFRVDDGRHEKVIWGGEVVRCTIKVAPNA